LADYIYYSIILPDYIHYLKLSKKCIIMTGGFS
jgi:hypothetical protein